jgi:predicted RNase H-like HicB family nuclease
MGLSRKWQGSAEECMREAPMTRFVATYTRDGRAWIVQFRDPDIATFGRTLASAKRYARSALAVYLEVDDLMAAGIEVVDDVRRRESCWR